MSTSARTCQRRVLAFVLLLLIPYAAMSRCIVGNAGERSRDSVLGPIDRVLGFGFGAVKGCAHRGVRLLAAGAGVSIRLGLWRAARTG